MKNGLLLVSLIAGLLLAPGNLKADRLARPALPFEGADWSKPANFIDACVLDGLRRKGLKPAPLCSDQVFIRRAYLDVIGTLPEPAEVTAFLDDPRPEKRAVLIDSLLERAEFADYWSLKWCDILRVKAEFPINLWPNAVQAYHRWIRDSLRENLPYDRFARTLLTSSGSNFRVPPVNFYRAVQGRDAPSIARVVALTLMGTRLETWPAERRAGLEACFSRISYKKTAEWKEEIVQLDQSPATAIETILPDGSRVRITPDQDPRRVFADWLLAPGNQWFARSIANRAWSWFMGYGIVHEPDDLRPDNPPVNPELLAGLEKYLVDNKYDLKLLFKAILNSNTYQQSSIPAVNHPEAERLFACYPVRQLEAEVLIDALNWIAGGGGEEYSSPIPEPFTFTPRRQRSILLSDGSITSPFLEMFGRPGRDTGFESERNRQPSAAQRLCLMNSSEIQRKINQSSRLQKMLASVKWNRDRVIEQTYLIILSRRPTREEAEIAAAYFQSNTSLGYSAANNDLAWTLINSKEFLCRH